MNRNSQANKLNQESQRLEAWYSLLGALTHSLWYTQDIHEKLTGFCQILVQRADFKSVQLLVRDETGGHSYEYRTDDATDVVMQQIQLPLLWQGQNWGSLYASAERSLEPGSEAYLLLENLAAELAQALASHFALEARHELQDNLELVALSVAQSPFAVVITNSQGILEYCNEIYLRNSGYSLAEVVGRPVQWNAGLPEQARLLAELAGLQAGQHWQGEVQNQRKDGSLYWEREIISTISDEAGRVTHLVALKEEITEVKSQLQQVEQALLLREQALVSSSNGIMITRSDKHDHSIVYVNPAFERITGYGAEEVIGREGRFLVREDLAQPDLEEIRRALREKREGKALLRNYRKDGSQFWNELHISPVKDASGNATTHFVSVINDVSERVNYQRELEYQATHDSLTGLANRNLLNDRIVQAIAWAKRQNLSVGVMLLDLDHFKLINDASGHGAGDEMLKQVAQRLSHCVRETDTVARLGGDEFVIVLTDLPESGDVDVVAEKILSALARPFEVNGHDVFVTASIGVSLYPRDGDHGEILLRYADIAMYRVKEYGRNSVRQFVPEMGTSAISRLNMEAALRRALERQEFVLHYQPKIDLRDGRLVGAEALIRWQHPQIGMVHPIEFIPLAEETGLILPLGEWVLRQACRQLVRWQAEGLQDLRIAINMSSRQFRQEDLAERVAGILQESGANPACITLELTESMVMQDVSSTLVALRALKQLGLSISLDDFGTGYSSLSYLRRFPIDELKIDKSFINDIHENPDDAAIASAIVAMALSLGLQVVAEGVENQAQADLLRKMGCNQVQGYYFSRPLDVAAFSQRYAGAGHD